MTLTITGTGKRRKAKKLASVKMSDPRGKSASDRRASKTKTRGNKQDTVKPLVKAD